MAEPQNTAATEDCAIEDQDDHPRGGGTDEQTAEVPPTLATNEAREEDENDAGDNVITTGAAESSFIIADTRKRKGPTSTRVCGVCSKEEGRYKCPLCSMPYCSVACNRTHRETHPPAPEPETRKQANTQQQRAGPAKPDHVVGDDPFRPLLEHRADIERLFARYPSLPAELERIQAVTLPPPPRDPLQQQDGGGGDDVVRGGLPFKLRNPAAGFDGGSNDSNNNRKNISQFGHNTGGKRQQQQQRRWSRDLGLRKGCEALRRARCNPGELGDGVREYCELVLHVLSPAPVAAGSGMGVGDGGAQGCGNKDVTMFVREEVLAEETKVIRRLRLEEQDGAGFD